MRYFAMAALTLGLTATTAGAQSLYGLVGLGGTDVGKRQVGTIGTDGSLSLLGTSTSIDGGTVLVSTGMTAYNHGAGLVYFVGRTADTLSRIFSVSTTTGATTASPVLSTGTYNSMTGIHYDEGDGRLTGIFNVAANDEQAGTIDPATGTVTLLGSPIGGEAVFTNFGVVAGDDQGDRIFFLGDTATTNPALYMVSTVTGAATSVEVSGVAYNSVVGMHWDDAEDVLYALVFQGAQRQLATIDTTTGAIATIGATTIGGGGMSISTAQGVTALDPAGDRFFFIGRLSDLTWNVFTVSTATGAGTWSAVNESAIQSGGYYGLEYGAAPVPVTLQSVHLE